MREPAVDDVGLLDPGFEAGQAGFDLGNHPAVDHAPGDQVVAPFGSQTPDQAGGFILVEQDPGGVGQENQLFSLRWPARRPPRRYRH